MLKHFRTHLVMTWEIVLVTSYYCLSFIHRKRAFTHGYRGQVSVVALQGSHVKFGKFSARVGGWLEQISD